MRTLPHAAYGDPCSINVKNIYIYMYIYIYTYNIIYVYIYIYRCSKVPTVIGSRSQGFRLWLGLSFSFLFFDLMSRANISAPCSCVSCSRSECVCVCRALAGRLRAVSEKAPNPVILRKSVCRVFSTCAWFEQAFLGICPGLSVFQEAMCIWVKPRQSSCADSVLASGRL